MPRRKPRTMMGLAPLQPVRLPGLARFLQLPIPCVYSLHRNSVVSVRGQMYTKGTVKEVRVQAVRLLAM